MHMCPQHGKPLKAGNAGDFYCPIPHGETPEGKKIWYRIKPTPAPTSAPAPVSQIPPSTNVSGDAIAAAALNFAGRLCQGAGPEMGDTVIALAIKAYSAMKAVQS
jgi:hypothetical protein